MFERPQPHAGFPGAVPEIDMTYMPARRPSPFQLSHFFQADDPYLEIADSLWSCLHAEHLGSVTEEGCAQDLVTASIKRWLTLNGVEGDTEELADKLTQMVGQRMGG